MSDFLFPLLWKIPFFRRIPYLTQENAKLRQRIEELNQEFADTGGICGRATPEDDRVSPDYSDGSDWKELIKRSFIQDDVRILEIGSRNVTGGGHRFEGLCDRRNYVGFDVGEGENVDVVGDAHKLSSYFPASSFDVVFSVAVFEHLAMPWVVAEEIAKVLTPGGIVITFTHFSFAEHELPWHFFQFNKGALRCLFNADLGFEEIECYHHLPMVGRFAYGCGEEHRGKLIPHLYCSTHHIARKILPTQGQDQTTSFDWRDALSRVYSGTTYPGT
jgi:SAM-dependent methyltransferase